MHIPRIYYASPLREDSTLWLENEAFHHLVRVLRLSLNDKIVIFNGEGGEYTARISAVEKRKAKIDILKFNPVSRETKIQLHLGQSIISPAMMDFVIQKSVELGVTEITPLLTERTQLKNNAALFEKKLSHWRLVIIQACEQCGRNQLPILHSITSLSNWTKNVNAKQKICLNPYAPKALAIHKEMSDIALTTGPEGGWSETELSLIKQQDFDFAKLGESILRAETASLAAIAVLSYSHLTQ